jgi:hypothetical protein
MRASPAAKAAGLLAYFIGVSADGDIPVSIGASQRDHPELISFVP